MSKIYVGPFSALYYILFTKADFCRFYRRIKIGVSLLKRYFMLLQASEFIFICLT